MEPNCVILKWWQNWFMDIWQQQKKKQLWWIIKDIWVLLFGFVEAGDIGRDGKIKTNGYYLFLKGSEYNTG